MEVEKGPRLQVYLRLTDNDPLPHLKPCRLSPTQIMKPSDLIPSAIFCQHEPELDIGKEQEPNRLFPPHRQKVTLVLSLLPVASHGHS
jgi:hypothetical protein